MERFRLATEADVDAILAMMRRYYAEDEYIFVESEAWHALMELIRNPILGCLWVAQSEDKVVGYMAVTFGYSLEYRGRDAFLDEFFILESARKQGLGREGLAVAESYCRGVGVQALHLEVESHQKAALELYRRAGFKDHRHLMTKWLASI